jgi:hypothetical protein
MSDYSMSRLSAPMTHFTVVSYSSNLREILSQLFVAARFPVSLNALHYSLLYDSELNEVEVIKLYFKSEKGEEEG